MCNQLVNETCTAGACGLYDSTRHLRIDDRLDQTTVLVDIDIFWKSESLLLAFVPQHVNAIQHHSRLLAMPSDLSIAGEISVLSSYLVAMAALPA